MKLATGGATWRSTDLKLAGHLQAWRQEASAQGWLLGTAVVWHKGNDIYHCRTGLPHYDETLSAVTESASNIIGSLLHEAEAVVVLGPLPHLSRETGPDGM